MRCLTIARMDDEHPISNLFVLSRHSLPLQPISDNEIELDGIYTALLPSPMDFKLVISIITNS